MKPEKSNRDNGKGVRFATTEDAELAIDWMLRELISLNPAAEAHYRFVARKNKDCQNDH